MLERVIKRKFYLQKHLAAPLLKEREYYLMLLEQKGLHRQTLLGIADYLLRIVELLDLKDENVCQVPLEKIQIASEKWSLTIKNHPMKRNRTPSSSWKFMRLATDWLGKIGRLDSRFNDSDLLLNQLFSRGFFKYRYLESPMLEERLEYLTKWKDSGASVCTLRNIAQYQLHLIDYLHIDQRSMVTEDDLLSAADDWWTAVIPGVQKKCMSKTSKRRFLTIGRGWLTYMNMLEFKEEVVFLRDKIEDYLEWLVNDKGYSERTTDTRWSMLKLFMKFAESKVSCLSELTACHIDDYIRKRHDIDGCNRHSISDLVSVLRNFLQYAESKGWCRKGLSQSFKSPRVYHLEDVPSYIPWENVQNIMHRTQMRNTASAIRDYAILSLLTVYGMRCSEVTGLRIKDIDWRKEELYLRRAKGCKPQVMPLIPEVGEAILRYIKEVRQNDSRHECLFLCIRAPYRCMSNAAVYRIVSALIKEEDVTIRHYGPHSLRHSCATHLVNSGHSMKEVGDLLGHQQIETTSIYAKVDLASLRKVAEMSWEGLL